MKFLSPIMLWLLLAVPALVALYLYVLKRKKKMALRYANIGMVKDAMGAGANLRRHVPAALFLMAITLMLSAIARPAAMITLPSQRSQVILAMDVSASMRAADVEPNRLVAAQTAAKTFIQEQPSSTQIGIVAFAGAALLVQPPTTNRDDLIKAIDRFQPQRGTAIGSGILVSLQTIFPSANFDNRLPEYQRGFGRESMGSSLDRNPEPRAAEENFTPVPPGSYESAVVILLTDGQATTGPDPVETARMAADRGVRIFTVGLGTKSGEIVGWGGRSMRVQLDEETLQTIADLTRGKYFFAGSGTDLKEVYKTLNTQFVMERKETEITSFFAAAAALFAIAAAGLSLLWYNRIL
ncbi:MAG: VWA domain-containing protein [Proteobacteria bacterium]|nr:VWA domain-containing protein [Pseudomonadota bacterium]